MKTIGIAISFALVALAGAALLTTTHPQEQHPVHSTPDDGTAQVVTLGVPEMDCSGCEVAIKIAANRVDGVEDLTTSLETRTARVTFDTARTSPAAIAEVIAKATGFKVDLPTAGKHWSGHR